MIFMKPWRLNPHKSIKIKICPTFGKMLKIGDFHWYLFTQLGKFANFLGGSAAPYMHTLNLSKHFSNLRENSSQILKLLKNGKSFIKTLEKSKNSPVNLQFSIYILENFETFSSARVDPPPNSPTHWGYYYKPSSVRPWFRLRKLLPGHTSERIWISSDFAKCFRDIWIAKTSEFLKLMKNCWFFK